VLYEFVTLGIQFFKLDPEAFSVAAVWKDSPSEAAGVLVGDHRGRNPTSPLYALARLGLARALVLEGDTSNARIAYQDFFALWKDADPETSPS
jgi:hypothetical protein